MPAFPIVGVCCCGWAELWVCGRSRTQGRPVHCSEQRAFKTFLPAGCTGGTAAVQRRSQRPYLAFPLFTYSQNVLVHQAAGVSQAMQVFAAFELHRCALLLSTPSGSRSGPIHTHPLLPDLKASRRLISTRPPVRPWPPISEGGPDHVSQRPQ